jgi:hypothetical protein
MKSIYRLKRNVIKMWTTRDSVSLSVRADHESCLLPIKVFVPSRKPISEVEIEEARANFSTLLEELPLKDGRCVIPIGENMAEVKTRWQEPASKEELDAMLQQIDGIFPVFPNKATKADIPGDYAE